MIMQKRNPELVDILRTDFQHRNEPNFAWKSAVSSVLAIPGLVGAWPMSVIRRDSTTDQFRDVAGGGYHLTSNNAVQVGYVDLRPYANFGGTNEYLSRVDGGAANWADITGTEGHIQGGRKGLTLGGWFKVDSIPDAAENTFMAKYLTTGDQRSYLLDMSAAGVARFQISVDGTAVHLTAGATLTQGLWHHIIGRFEPSGTNSVFVDGDESTNAAAVPASIFDSTAAFTIGAIANPSRYLDGRASLCFLSQMMVNDALVFSLFQQQRAMFGV